MEQNMSVREEKATKVTKKVERLYEQLHQTVEGKFAAITRGVGWYSHCIGDKFKITGIQNFEQVPHLKIEHNDVNFKAGKVLMVQWNHCKVECEKGLQISIYELCRQICREEKTVGN